MVPCKSVGSTPTKLRTCRAQPLARSFVAPKGVLLVIILITIFAVHVYPKGAIRGAVLLNPLWVPNLPVLIFHGNGRK